ncbi:MAG: hypothetical protein LJE67_00840 [Salaquimonas sp.]|jgi:plasmid stability protein|nr:hypothetical protein [Salaquimonas sp.]
MGQILIRNVSGKALEALKLRARLKGSSMEQEARLLIESVAALTPEERMAESRKVRAMQEHTVAEMPLEAVREGLE